MTKIETFNERPIDVDKLENFRRATDRAATELKPHVIPFEDFEVIQTSTPQPKYSNFRDWH